MTAKYVSEEDLDPELTEAIDNYLTALRKRMIIRARKGEAEYQGLWKTLTHGQLMDMLREEEDDIHVYKAMMGGYA